LKKEWQKEAWKESKKEIDLEDERKSREREGWGLGGEPSIVAVTGWSLVIVRIILAAGLTGESPLTSLISPPPLPPTNT